MLLVKAAFIRFQTHLEWVWRNSALSAAPVQRINLHRCEKTDGFSFSEHTDAKFTNSNIQSFKNRYNPVHSWWFSLELDVEFSVLLWHIWCYHVHVFFMDVFFLNASGPAALRDSLCRHMALCVTQHVPVRQLARKLFGLIKHWNKVLFWKFDSLRGLSHLTFKRFLVFQKSQTERTPSERVLTLRELEARKCLGFKKKVEKCKVCFFCLKEGLKLKSVKGWWLSTPV